VKPDEYHPNICGFDEFYGFLGGSRTYFYNTTIDVEGNPNAIMLDKEIAKFDI